MTRSWFSFSFAFAFALSGVALERSARADTAKLDRFDVAERGSKLFVADSLELPSDRLRVDAGVIANYAHGLRTFGTPVEGTNRSLVRDALALHTGASVVLPPGARFSLDFPVLFQSGKSTNLAGNVYAEPRSPTLGDLRASFDLKLAESEPRNGGTATLAAGVTAWLPTGSADDYASDGYARVGVHVAGAAHLRSFVLALRAGYTYRRELGSFGSVRPGSTLDATAGAAWTNDVLTIGPEVHASTILRDDAFGLHATPVEALFGAHVALGRFTLGAGFGTSLVRGLGAPDGRALLSASWSPALARDVAADRDHDGVPDDRDACPDVAGTASGCPGAPTDRDGDGVRDADDACPDRAGPRERTGCPALRE